MFFKKHFKNREDLNFKKDLDLLNILISFYETIGITHNKITTEDFISDFKKLRENILINNC